MNLYNPSDDDRAAYADLSIIILTPCKDYEVPVLFAKDVANMIAYSWLHGLKIYQMGVTQRMVVHWGRNELARLAKDHINEYTGEKFTHLLWLDDDHVFTPDLGVCLARSAHLDMVSALYYGRSERHLPVAYVKDTTADKYKHFPLIDVESKLCQVDAVGMGACLMRRDLLERLDDPWFQFKDCGEDIYFCVHAKEQGAEVWLDGTYQLGHIGDPQIITHKTHEAYLKDNQDLFADRVKVALGGKKVA